MQDVVRGGGKKGQGGREGERKEQREGERRGSN